MDPNDVSVRALFLADGKILARFLDGEGHLLEPQPFLVRARYVSSAIELEHDWRDIQKELLAAESQFLLWISASPDGPPYRVARVFYHGGTSSITVGGGRKSLLAQVLYPVGMESRPWDKRSYDSQQGFFVTGDGGPSNIWRIHRVERDAWRGPLLTLAPLLLAPGFPMVDLSSVGNPDRRREITSHYDELQRCILTNAYRSAITRAKDIAEALITDFADTPPNDPFHNKLENIFAKLKAGKMPLSWLTFTLCQKIRQIHKRTHPEHALGASHSVSPELALSVVQDLIEILRDLGYVKEPPRVCEA